MKGNVRKHSMDRINNSEYDEISRSKRVIQSGFSIVQIIPNSTVRTYVGTGRGLRIVNTSDTVAYVVTGDNTVTAPTGVSDGAAVLGYSEVFINTGDRDHVITSSSSLQVIVITDEV